MSLILCATRGGSESLVAQDLAIEIAKEQRLPLAFIYISDTSFLDQMAAEVIVDVNSELSNLGEFFLNIAVNRAQESGVDAEAIIRTGHFPETLIHASDELGAKVIVLGHPSGDTGQFDVEAFQACLEDIAEQTGVEVRTA